MEVDAPRLHHGELIVVIHLEDAVHPHERDDEPPLGRQAPPGQPRARPARDEGHPLALGEPDQRGDMLGRAGEDHEVCQRAEEREPVGLVDHELVGVREHGARAQERFHLPAEGLLPGLRQRRHGGRKYITGSRRRMGAAAARYSALLRGDRERQIEG